MTIATRLLSLVTDPSHPALVAGSQEEQRRARREWRQAKDAQGIRTRWDEIPAERIVSTRYWLEDTQSGDFYREFHGDPGYAASVVAYYERDGWPVMLEPASPRSRAELERRQAAKAKRRADHAAAAKLRYDELRKGARR
jgi:hypothetical protein